MVGIHTLVAPLALLAIVGAVPSEGIDLTSRQLPPVACGKLDKASLADARKCITEINKKPKEVCEFPSGKVTSYCQIGTAWISGDNTKSKDNYAVWCEDIATIAQEIIDTCGSGSTISGTRLLSRDTANTSIRVSAPNK